jgi:hypothetical protein
MYVALIMTKKHSRQMIQDHEHKIDYLMGKLCYIRIACNIYILYVKKQTTRMFEQELKHIGDQKQQYKQSRPFRVTSLLQNLPIVLSLLTNI